MEIRISPPKIYFPTTVAAAMESHNLGTVVRSNRIDNGAPYELLGLVMSRLIQRELVFVGISTFHRIFWQHYVSEFGSEPFSMRVKR
jgi:hypothetical protein